MPSPTRAELGTSQSACVHLVAPAPLEAAQQSRVAGPPPAASRTVQCGRVGRRNAAAGSRAQRGSHDMCRLDRECRIGGSDRRPRERRAALPGVCRAACRRRRRASGASLAGGRRSRRRACVRCSRLHATHGRLGGGQGAIGGGPPGTQGRCGLAMPQLHRAHGTDDRCPGCGVGHCRAAARGRCRCDAHLERHT